MTAATLPWTPDFETYPITHAIASARLEQEETLLLYTDGVPEATSKSGEQFSEERLQSLVGGWRGDAEGLLAEIAKSIGEFTDGAKQHDDITMLASHRQTV